MGLGRHASWKSASHNFRQYMCEGCAGFPAHPLWGVGFIEIEKPSPSRFAGSNSPALEFLCSFLNFTGLRLMPPALLVKNLSFLRSHFFLTAKNRRGNFSKINRKSIQFQPKIDQNSSLDRSLWGYGGSWLASWRPGSTLAGFGPPPTLQMEPC